MKGQYSGKGGNFYYDIIFLVYLDCPWDASPTPRMGEFDIINAGSSIKLFGQRLDGFWKFRNWKGIILEKLRNNTLLFQI
jgi:hypothetical protein